MFENGAWYQGDITSVDYIKSEKKGTPGLELTVEVSDRGPIVGQWWLTDSLVNDPQDKTHKVPMWEAAKIRCKLFGCTEELLNGSDWIDHIRTTLIGQSAAVCAEVNSYGDVKAQFIGKPKGGGGGASRYVKQDKAPSPFAARPARNADPFAVSDDDVPF